MSKITDLQLIKNKSGGSTLTKIGREAILNKSVNDLKNHLKITSIHGIKDIKVKHAEKLVDFWKKNGISNRTIQNRMSVLRTSLVKVGMTNSANSERLTTKNLGIQASRNGTHSAPTIEYINEKVSKLDSSFSICANLQIHIGLRAREAVSAGSSISTWMKEIENGGIIVTRGTKGGKSRRVDFSNEDRRKKAITAIKDAISYCKSHGEMIIKSSSLEGAMRSYQRALLAVGFSGSEASHCFRYYFAVHQFLSHLEIDPTNEKEALARLSLDLGHGDGRGRYCKQVYLKSLNDSNNFDDITQNSENIQSK